METDSRAYARAFAKIAGPGGRDWLEAVEIDNEPGNYSDADYARLFDAMSRGIREGDPKLKIATCNVTAGKSGKYENPWRFSALISTASIFSLSTPTRRPTAGPPGTAPSPKTPPRRI